MSDNLKYCQGCNVYQTCKCTDDSDNCPCLRCLVKMICETGCGPYDKFEHDNRMRKDDEYKQHIERQGRIMAK